MSNATFEPLVTDYTVEWDDAPPEGVLTEGETHEHGVVKFENGYEVSILRTNAAAAGSPSLGVENGNWEAVICRPATGIYKMMGMLREPAGEMDHLTNTVVEGHAMCGDLDNAAVNKLFADVQAAPAYVAPEGEQSENPFQTILDIIGGDR